MLWHLWQGRDSGVPYHSPEPLSGLEEVRSTAIKLALLSVSGVTRECSKKISAANLYVFKKLFADFIEVILKMNTRLK
jgi:hypothetical protein